MTRVGSGPEGVPGVTGVIGDWAANTGVSVVFGVLGSLGGGTSAILCSGEAVARLVSSAAFKDFVSSAN